MYLEVSTLHNTMKQQLLFVLAICLSFANHLMGQQCEYAEKEIDNGSISYRIGQGGHLKTQGSGYTSSELLYRFQTNLMDYNTSQGLYTGLILTGYRDGVKYEARNKYSISNYDYEPGLLDENGSPIFDGPCNMFNKIWAISRTDIEELAYLQETGVALTRDNVPVDILTWPAKGNPHFEEVYGYLIDRDLAYFTDADGDGLYDPVAGDLPLALEEYPSFMPFNFTFHVYHDVRPHPMSMTDPIGVEVIQRAYQMQCDEYPLLNYATFTRLDISYRGQETLDSFDISIFDDTDNGCFMTDGVGWSASTQTSFGYDIDGMDQEACSVGLKTYPPNTTGINTKMVLNDSVARFKVEEGLQDISFPDSIAYDYTDYPNIEEGWSTQNDTFLDEQYFVISTSTINKGMTTSGTTYSLDYAEHIVLEKSNIGLALFEEYDERIAAFKEQYAARLAADDACNILSEQCMEDCVWPGDVNDDGIVTMEDYLVQAFIDQQLINKEQSKRPVRSLTWNGWESEDWTESYLGVNAKYADIDGNGLLDYQADSRHLLANLWEARDGIEYPEVVPDFNEDGLSFTFDNDEEIDMQGSVLDRIAEFSLRIEADELDYELQAFSFDIVLGDALISSELASILIDRTFSPFRNENIVIRDYQPLEGDMLAVPGRVHYGFYLYEQPVTNGGRVMEFGLEVKEGFTTSNFDLRDTISFTIENIIAIDANGEYIELGVNEIEPVIVKNALLTSTEEVRSTILIYPNPIADLVHIETGGTMVQEVTVLSSTGIQIYNSTTPSASSTINTDLWPAGIYYITVRTAAELLTKKVVKL